DVLYLLPVVTLLDGVEPFLLAASIGAPLFAAWVVIDYWRIVRRGAGAGAPNSTEIQPSK
ncbi:CDP-alcohol phosphatidyltransferase family protein, partial [Ralstonia sp. VS2407]